MCGAPAQPQGGSAIHSARASVICLFGTSSSVMPARVVPVSFGDAAAVVIVEKRRQRANGKAAKRLTPSHWRDALLNVQFANAAYGGGGAVEGEQQPIVRELPAQARHRACQLVAARGPPTAHHIHLACMALP